MIINIVMIVVGENTNFSSCWLSANDKITINTKYNKTDNKDRKKITYNAEDYEKGKPRHLDFSCKSNIVKAQFSCETLKIVEKHLYDFDAISFHNVINNNYEGSFEKYAQSLGGIFGEYYGKKIEGRTTSDFQKAAEYVLGWMYMYGWDYASEEGNNKGTPFHGKERMPFMPMVVMLANILMLLMGHYIEDLESILMILFLQKVREEVQEEWLLLVEI